MLTEQIRRVCVVCKKPLSGRTDKKFCDQYCRASFNNIRKHGAATLTNKINYALVKNRKILRDLLDGTATTKTISRETLLMAGFQFKYLTHILQNRKKTTCFFCYDFGYIPIQNDQFRIVKAKPE